MARALRSSGASSAAATPNGAGRTRVLKRKRTGDDDHSPQPAPRRDTDSASPLTDLAPSPAVKHEDDDLDGGDGVNGDDNGVNGDGDEPNGDLVDGCDQPPPASDAHKLLTVLEMFDTQGLLTRTVGNSTLRAMLKKSTCSIRALKAAVAALLPAQSPRALSLEQTAQRTFCDLALGLLDEISEKRPASTLRTSIFQASQHTGNDRPVRYALQQAIYGTDYYTSISADSLTREKAATLATGQASLTAIIPAAPIPASAMPTLAAYSRKPVMYHSPWLGLRPTVPAMLELSYGPHASFAPTYDSSGSSVTRSEIDSLVARRNRPSRAFGPPPPLPPPLPADTLMADDPKPLHPPIHPDLAPVPALGPSLGPTSPSTSPSTPKLASALDPTLDPDLCNALDAAFQELALEDSVRNLLQSNARAMTQLVDIQNQRFQRWNSKKPDLAVLDVDSEELELARCIEKTLGLLASLRPRTILSSLPDSSPAPTSLIPPASALRALHRTLPTEPSPGYRGTLDPRRDTSLRDDTTIKMAHVPPPAPAPTAAATPRQAPPVAARPSYPVPPAGSTYYPQQYPQAQVGQYSQGQGVYPQGQHPGYQAQQPGQYSATQPVQYPATPAAAAAGQPQYPYPYTYLNAQAQGAGYPQTAAAQPGAGATPVAGQATVYPTPTPGQATSYPAPATAGTYPTPVPAAGGTPRVITNVIKPAAQGVWSPGQGYTATPTTATPGAGYTLPSGSTYNPLVAASSQTQYPVYTPATPGAGYTPSPTAVQAQGYAATPGQAYSPAVGAYAPTPVKPGPRGPIPPHVRSTPGTPASPTAYLPPTQAAAVPVAGAYAAWNGARGGTPSTPRPA